MVDTVAVLGVAVESAEAERDLRNFQQVAKRTGETVEQVAARFKKMRDEAKNLPNPLREVSNEASRVGNQLQQMVTGSKAAEVAIKGLSRIIGGMVSTMVTGGIAGITAAVTTYALDAFGAVRGLDEKIRQHAEIVRSLKEAYGDAGKGVDTMAREAAAVLKTLLGFKTDEIKKEFQSLSVSISKSLSDFRITGLGPAIEENSRKFVAFNDVITTFKQSVKDGAPDVLAFRRGVQQIADTTADQKTRDLAKELLEMTAKASGAQLAIENTAKALRGFSADALAAAEQGEAFSKALKALDSTVTPNLSARERIMKNYNAAVESAGSTEERMAAARARDDQLSILSANERKKALQDAAREAEAAAKRYQTLVGSIEKHIAVTNAATVAVGQGVGSLAALREESRQTSNDNAEAQEQKPAKAA